MKFYVNYYGEEMGKDKYMGLQSLIKNNDGLYKSDKQGKFILNKWTLSDEFVKGSWIEKYTDSIEGKKFIEVEGFYSFGHGKGRGHRPASFLYEVDHAGIVKRYRARYKEGDSVGSYGLKSIECDFERTVETPEKKEEAPINVGNHIGEIGKRITGLQVTVTGTTNFETVYGLTYVNKMEDAEGNQLTWFSQNELDKDCTYTMNATVKEHKEFRGVKQTVVTRCMKVSKIS